MLRLLGEELSARFGSSGMKNFCDTAPLSEKSWAVRAGLGWQGRNSLLINPGAGSYLFLGGIVTDMPADIYDKPYAGTGCGECRRCVDACPAGAILPEGNRIDAGRCISKLTVERCSARKGSTEKDSVESFSVENGPAPRLDGWIFGCDECQSVCPHNISAPMFRNPAFAPIFDPLSLDRHYWLSLSEEEFRAGFSSTPLARAGLERIKSMFRVC
jgi:epoxyqueuosine reductase